MAIKKWKTLTNTSNAIFGPIEPSQNWYSGFLDRHPDMRTVWATKMEAGRHTNATAPKLNDFFEKTLKPCFEKWGYDKHLVANTDETQLRITATERPRIIVRKAGGLRYVKEGG